jgi:hypothetical protein
MVKLISMAKICSRVSALLLALACLGGWNSWSLNPVSAEEIESPSSSDTTVTTPSDYHPAELTSQIVDPNNILSASRTEVQEAIDRAWSEAQEKLYVIFLPRFDGATTPDEWIDKTAELTGLSPNSVIYAVAYESGQLTVFIPEDSVNLSVSHFSNIANAAESHLVNAAWGDSVKAVAESIVAQTVLPAHNYFLIVIIIGAVGLGVAGYLIYFFVFRNKRKVKKAARRAVKSIAEPIVKATDEFGNPVAPVEAEKIVSELVQNPEVIDPSVTSTDVAAIKIDSWIAKRRKRKDLPAKKRGSGRRRIK